jgi:molybdate transport system substrate-binding protein
VGYGGDMLCRATGVTSLIILLLIASTTALADIVRVAVASNFAGPARDLAAQYEAQTGQSVSLSTASSGKLYAQIRAGAPFDVFLSADERRPLRLVRDGLAKKARVYAMGRLALVSADPTLNGRDCRAAFLEAVSPTLAIANPETAPYGLAASTWLSGQPAGGTLKIVRGENVGQALGFVASGNARFGIVALPQLSSLQANWPGCVTALPAKSHPPVRQAAALLEGTGAMPAAVAFYDFLFSESAAATISDWGYAVPEHP